MNALLTHFIRYHSLDPDKVDARGFYKWALNLDIDDLKQIIESMEIIDDLIRPNQSPRNGL